MRRLAWSLLLAVAAACPAFAYPDRPVTLVVPFAPGGTIDVLARVLGPALSTELGQPVVIDTRPGAGGNVGAAYVAIQSRPDAHTILFTGAGLASSVSLSTLGFDPVKDLVPVLGMGAIPSLMVVSNASPHRSLADVLAAARARPGTVSYGSSGPNTGSHLAGVLLAAATGTELLHVPYRGSGAVYPDLMAQRIDILLDIMASSIGQVQQGSVRAIGITSRQRSNVLPEVPAIAESVPGFAFETWVGLFTRAGAPEDSLRRLEAAALRAMRDPVVQERLRLSAAQPIPSDRAGFTAYFREDVDRWAAMVQQGRLQKAE
ncbi:tripartite tricarboxylate transporter substrate binding protein [Roseococcus sp. SYP-B2431]|uniref:tripartite tricarboxylate transporter substrate binding protein n=1 Tax=Roseococcus sp. SYP-B2431 TaxID=2496640 RepID=UPI00103F5D46|nr:tripartite tricarboxylate transporter substrate binding protein [Roseococcus sp. SYP-B2431]TCI00832.1 tripartite tricarboxylate transporter substrate binding protein [Roseococcus sp. SYP-B2431]